jgi:hypothetical protein
MPTSFLDSLLSERPTSPLYHYTTTAGLIGIVESKSLWASGIQYLNDTTEYRHATSVAMDLLRRKLATLIDPRNDLYQLMLKGESLYRDDTAVFVGSLSEAKDKLSQWRAYCRTEAALASVLPPNSLNDWRRNMGSNY